MPARDNPVPQWVLTHQRRTCIRCGYRLSENRQSKRIVLCFSCELTITPEERVKWTA